LLSFIWNQKEGTSVTLLNEDMTAATFTPTESGLYIFSLVVSDGKSESGPDEVRITVIQPNRVPTANAGSDQVVPLGTTVHLDAGASIDLDSDALTYRWIPPSEITLSNTASNEPEFMAISLGTYRILLVVSDGLLVSEADEVLVTVFQPNREPLAYAGADQEVEVGSTVQLDGSGSSDLDGDSLGYTWKQTEGPSVSLSSENTTTSIFTPTEAGIYIFSLIVYDGQVESTPDHIKVTAIQPKNTGDAEIIGEVEEDTGDAQVIGEVEEDTGDAQVIGEVEE